MKRKFKTGILVRNNRIESMQKEGLTVDYTVLSEEEYSEALKEKLLEEANEVITANNSEDLMWEVADLLEVIDHIVEVNNLDKKTINNYKDSKQKSCGKFDKKYKVNWIEIDEEKPSKDYYKTIEYYLSQPWKYTEIK